MSDAPYTFGPFVFDPAGGMLRREGEPVAVGQRALALLELLLSAGGEPVSKDALMEGAWGGLIVEEANLSVQIAHLRKILGKAPNGSEWIITVPRFGYRLLLWQTSDAVSAHPVPLLAVLPFGDLSGDAGDAYFAEGLVEDITAALSRFKNLAVIARSAFPSALGAAQSRIETARKLDVRYLLEGSVRRREQSVRVGVRLIDTGMHTHLWAGTFDGDMAHLFEFQDSLAAAVIGIVEPELRKAEIARASRKHPGDLGAYDLYLRALPHFRGTSPDDRRQAIELLEQAVERDPGFATAVAHAAWAYERQDTFGSGMTGTERRRSLELAEKALETGFDDPLVVAICALVFLNVGGAVERSLAMLSQAQAANPNNPTILSLSAFANVMAGDLAVGRDCFLRALRISPNALENYELLVGVALSYLLDGEFEESLGWSRQSLAINGGWLGAYWALAAGLAHLDRMAEAAAVIATLRQKAPDLRVADLQRIGGRYASRFGLVMEGVRKAGLPD